MGTKVKQQIKATKELVYKLRNKNVLNAMVKDGEFNGECIYIPKFGQSNVGETLKIAIQRLNNFPEQAGQALGIKHTVKNLTKDAMQLKKYIANMKEDRPFIEFNDDGFEMFKSISQISNFYGEKISGRGFDPQDMVKIASPKKPGKNITNDKTIIEYQPWPGRQHLFDVLKDMYDLCFGHFVIDFIFSEGDLKDKFLDGQKLSISGDKIIYTYIPMPNPAVNVVIDFNGTKLTVDCNSDLTEIAADWHKKNNLGMRYRVNMDFGIDQAIERYHRLVEMKKFMR